MNLIIVLAVGGIVVGMSVMGIELYLISDDPKTQDLLDRKWAFHTACDATNQGSLNQESSKAQSSGGKEESEVHAPPAALPRENSPVTAAVQ